MTLLDKLTYLHKSGLALLLVPFFFACDDPTQLGLELDGTDNKLETHKLELVLPATTIYIDSLRTDHFNYSVVGQYTDSVFGTSRATSFNKYGLKGGTLPKGDTAFSSAYIRLRVYDVRTDNNLASETISVHQAQDTLYSTAVYTADKSLPYDSEPIGTTTFSFNVSSTSPDTIVSIPLSDEFGEFIFNRLTEGASRDSLTGGLYHFRPLVFVPGESNKALFSFDLADDTTGIYIEMKDSLGSIFHYTFDFQEKHFTHLDRDKSGAKLSDLNTEYTPSTNTPNRSYVDMISGIYTKLELTPLFDFIEANENILVNSSSFSYGPTTPPSIYIDNLSAIQHYFIKGNGTINGPAAQSDAGAALYAILRDNSYFSNTIELLSTPFDKDNLRYQSNVTFFSQRLFDNFRLEEDYLTEELVILSPFSLSLGQTTFRNPEFKLTLYYTTIKK